MPSIPIALQGAVLESRKFRMANFHNNLSSKVNLNDPRTRTLFIIFVVAVVVFLLFVAALVVFGRREWARKKDGKKPRWGRALLKAAAVATFLWIPIWIAKKIRARSKARGSYNKLDEAAGAVQPQAAWYGASAAPASVTAAAAADYSYYGVHDISAPLQPYDGVYGHAAVPTGYVAPKYDPPASLPDDARRSVSPAPPPYHQPPSPEMHGAAPAQPAQAENGAWNPSK